ncbi:glycosyl hydrolase family 79 C-terminal domain-containing protein [Phytohabitans houttuyneae]|uniref:Beta-glucuronidase C-terminal domain-containing protein n=1 Tax=Phytohabitans houttuyneae TaxID=1076126 RepID=A0A6V8KEY7_9ACTN|nr:glycosyl hydrolase family 79 C-terminal domain-containing protein [Phytohabitans houttuyneae]GFJ80908.1 hypothetical protein Phou_050880 [Phytohabitans houttuyneae]
MRILRAGCAAAAGLAILAGLGGAAAAPTPDSAATVVVDTSQPGGRLPSDFVGLSFEVRELGIGNIDARRGNLAQFFRTLGRSNVRFSGNTLDRDAIWLGDGQQLPDPLPEWVQHIITPADIERLDDFLAATGWDTAVGINLGRWDAERAADQAAVMSRVLGRRLLAAECGNEPDQWVSRGYRPAGYAYADYRRDWQMCAGAVGRMPLAGPDAASPTSAWAANLARDEGDRLKMIMIHQYSMDPTGTMERLLSPATNAGQAGAATPNLTVAKQLGKPIRIDETNSAWGGGIDGVSNRHGSALWALDYALQMGQLGLDGINFHGGLGVCNQPIWNGRWQLYTPMCASSKAEELAQVYRAMPIFYGLWMARQMGPGTFLPVTVTTDRNVNAYAVRGDDGRTRIAVIQKEETTTGPVSVAISVGGRDRTARVLTMTGSGLTADDTAVQGARVGTDGRLAPAAADRRPVRGGTVHIELAAGSAALITLDR